MDWKLVLLAPITVGILAGCQSGSHDDAAPPPSPFSGFWVNETSVNALNSCESSEPGSAGQQDVVLDAIAIHNDGQVFRWAAGNNPRAQENLSLGVVAPTGEFQPKISSPGAASYGFNYGPSYTGDPRLNLNEGVFVKQEGDQDHIYLFDSIARINKRFVRSSDANLRAHHAAIIACLGRYNIGAGQVGPGQQFAQPQQPYPPQAQAQFPQQPPILQQGPPPQQQFPPPPNMNRPHPQPLPPPGQYPVRQAPPVSPQPGLGYPHVTPPPYQGDPAPPTAAAPPPTDMQDSYPPGYK